MWFAKRYFRKQRNGGQNITYNKKLQNYGLISFRQEKVTWVNFANIMTTQFITNQDKLLSDVVKNILPCAERLYFLVGYFYFSGFQEIYKQVTDKEVKILVGLEVERDLANRIKEFQVIQEVNAPRGKIRDNYYKSLVQLFNDTDFFDSKEKQEAFRLFLGKMKDGTLEIKKTLQSNHAKLYIFENNEEFSQGGEYPGTVNN